jgi:hypothetical protein
LQVFFSLKLAFSFRLWVAGIAKFSMRVN